jgi:putative permease
MQFIREWFQSHLSNPQVVGLALLLAVGFGVVVVMGHILAPLIASIIIAYLLEGLVGFLERLRVPRLIAVILVFLAFMAVLLFLLVALLPLLSQQEAQLFAQLPRMISRGHEVLLNLPERYPTLFTESQVDEFIGLLQAEASVLAQHVLSLSVASVVGLLTLTVYLVIVPFLVFFFLKDKQRILAWLSNFLPRERELISRVWRHVDHQIGNYVRGIFIRMFIVGGVSYVTFAFMELQFAVLLSVLVGLSVLVPYIGAIVVTVPIALVAFFQWGWSAELAYVVIAYTVIQQLDGNVLTPILFSEVVNLHPIAIIVAILVFGGIWGFWGIFFAIPLATLVEAVLQAWPRLPPREESGPRLLTP